jgi:hypothetical protein
VHVEEAHHPRSWPLARVEGGKCVLSMLIIKRIPQDQGHKWESGGNVCGVKLKNIIQQGQ